MPITRPQVVSKIYLLAHETRARAYLASPVTKSILYQSRYGLVKTKGSVDPELRTRVDEMEVCTISFKKHFEKNKLCRVYEAVSLLL